MEQLLPHLADLLLDEVEFGDDGVVLSARVRSSTARCRDCRQPSARIHGRYQRRLRDVTVGGAKLVLQLQVRRFRCDSPGCAVMTFAEQVDGVTAPHARLTPGLRGLLTEIGLALAGRAGTRLASALGMPAGRDTLLRLVKALPDPKVSTVKVLGVDDFAFRRGRHYGTVLIDMDTHRPIEMFDGRDGDSLAAWLKQHPGVEIICRDRAGGYGEGARQGAPDAVQVADRFHLWQNLGQAVEKTINLHRTALAAPAPPPADATAPKAVQPPPEKKIIMRLRENYTAVQELAAQGMSKAAIGRKLGLHPATVRKFANARSADDLTAITEQRTHVVDPFTGYLHQRWNEGERNATQLFREIQQQGYPGGELAVQRYLRTFRKGLGHAADPGPKPPTVRQVTSWIMTHPDRVDTRDAAKLRDIRNRDHDLNRLVKHVRAFAVMMTGRHGDRLDDWITTVEKDNLAPLAGFARNLRRDIDAIRNGLTLPQSSGPVEGSINRLKMIKRQMFGRAGLALLRKRVLLAR
ncbi:ISL3 family transposase [Actinoplanes sp. NPDC051851]|uniref:ISL3 family transposase n=1 Tax=Actinoplanes sp. NPDC051851 TaxID=3154753 RepID=UPI003437797A